MAEKLKMQSSDVIGENISFIEARWPNVIKEVKNEDGKLIKAIDFDALKQELSREVISEKQERYQMTWPDKKKAVLAANSSINATLRPIIERSLNFDNTKNLYIEGDNLDVLKLLRETYLNKVNLIYIDPPYNTGNDFLYLDDFEMCEDDYLERSGQFDAQGNKMVTNEESNGRFHTDWLNLMYPRLKVARDLLSEDGVIFISIDDNEYANLKNMCDEIFGSKNCLSIHHVQVRYANKNLNEKKAFQECIEYILIYAKDATQFKPNQPYDDYSLEPFCYEIKELASPLVIDIGGKKAQVFKKGDYELIKHKEGKIGLLKGTWASGSVVKGNASGKFFETYLKPRKNIDGLSTLYKIYGIGEDGIGYRYFSGPNKEDATQGLFYSGVPLVRLEEIRNGTSKKYKPIANFYDFSGDFGNIRQEGGIAFNSGKKPIKMLKQFINYSMNKDALIMDFFSGSASTGHAVMSANSDDGGSRRFIMVQIPENCDPDSDAYNLGFKTICDLGEQRLRNSGKKIIQDNPLTTQELDVGFRVLKLDSSNMKDVYYNPKATQQEGLFASVDNVKEDRTSLDLLFQVMLELGIELSAKISEKEIDGKQVYVINDSYLVACFASEITENVIRECAKINPVYVVFRDNSFANDSDNINCEQIIKTISPSTELKVI